MTMCSLRHLDTWAIFRVLLLLFLSPLTKGQFEGDSCRLQSDGSQGVCTSIKNCPQVLNDRTNTPQLCIFIRNDPIVCCPVQSNAFDQNQSQPGSFNPAPSSDFDSPSQSQNPQPSIQSSFDDMSGFISIRDGEGTQRISQRKCEEYSKMTTSKFSFVPLVIDPPVYEVEVPQCDYTVPLIVGGEEAKPAEFPHMAAIGWDSETSNSIVDWNCGGVLISEDTILTAAHCTHIRGVQPKYIRVGDHNLARTDDDGDPQQINIREIIRHPEYRSSSKYNDIAVIKLEKRPKLGKFVRPACLWQTQNINYTKTVATGWGQIDFSGPKSDTLQKVTLDIIPNYECSPLFEINRKLQRGIVDTQMCAGYLDGGKDTCQGDSGGPIQVVTPGNICIFHIVGLTSFGKSCGGVNAPGVYTRVSSYLDWIEPITWPGQ
uniref:Putative serine protease snake-like zootermopsis nevadensis n=1 Tax=Lutzomyia longipalpis TaxID=7200 RepID=A0A1B0CS99_LUTLO